MGPKICNILKSYLTNRTQRTKLGNLISSCKGVSTGVPQGSTLGPQLYTVYSGDLPDVTDLLRYTIYADDTWGNSAPLNIVLNRYTRGYPMRLGQPCTWGVRWG